MNRRRNARIGGVAAAAVLALMASACSAGAPGAASADPTASEGRLAVAYAGGVRVLDPETLQPVGDFASEDFIRLNSAGDGRHVFVTTKSGFQVLDTAEPALTDSVVPATAAGHVVRHAGKTVLYDDGTSTTTIFDTAQLATSSGSLPTAETYTAPAAHHGVSIVLADGTLLTTVGDETSRSGVRALTQSGGEWREIAASTDCPGVHGEGTAANEAVIFGCENGALLYKDGSFTKFTATDAYGRMGNAYVSESSPIVVGDYKNDPDAEGYLLNSVTLIDTATHDYRVVELPDGVEYTFRDVARGGDGLAYILGTDGAVHVLDPASGEIVKSWPVIGAWQGPAEWQDPHPAIVTDGTSAYITEPATSTITKIDLATGSVLASVVLDVVPNEMALALSGH